VFSNSSSAVPQNPNRKIRCPPDPIGHYNPKDPLAITQMKAALAPLALDATDTKGTGVQNDAWKIVQNDNATDKAALA
jgi:hypothetical protein